MAKCKTVSGSDLAVGRRLATSRNEGASYAKGGMIKMPQAPVAGPKKPKFGGAMPMKAMKKGGKC